MFELIYHWILNDPVDAVLFEVSVWFAEAEANQRRSTKSGFTISGPSGFALAQSTDAAGVAGAL